MNNGKRLIEVDFPLEQVSLDCGARKERPSRTHLDAAHLAGAAAARGKPGGADRHVAA